MTFLMRSFSSTSLFTCGNGVFEAHVAYIPSRADPCVAIDENNVNAKWTDA